jgi:hypothetical protein
LHPDDGDETLLHHRPTERIPVHVEIECAACVRRWRGRLHRHERSADDA